ncbi:MAG: single-stranded-DNA-specific exonuclease RecJ [Defluviitaleaceae bacterium]|nr:single-stranded-DNA-specific exonuclease RecJ [Defluviitaleaceae bacterium]
MKTSRWVVLETDADLTLMSKVLGISPVTANVMANRGLRTKKTALNFLAPSSAKMHDTLEMKGVAKAIALLSQAIKEKSKIMIYGDYDVDGVMSTVILYKMLVLNGANVDFYIPHRIEEGYGLNEKAVRQLYEDGVEILLTVDNGISAMNEITIANELGMKVIVLDHHEPGFVETDAGREDELPPAAVIIDPKQADCPYPFKELCAGGLAYKLAIALGGLTGDQQDELLALAAIATVCDIVNLQDENRIIVKEGLKILNANKLINPGLGSLITTRGYLDKPIDGFCIGFVLGPCLNATGRLGSARKSVELLLTVESTMRIAIAAELCSLNDERKKLTTDCVSRAISSLSEPLDKILVLTDIEAHESVAGIVAGRIKEDTGRPTILLTQGDGAMKGSGRSIEGYNLFEALFAHKHLFTRFGGHPMAAGLTMPSENIPKLREALNGECSLTENDFIPSIFIDRELEAADINLKLSNELTRLAPFGKGNREPLFLSRKLYVEHCRVINEKSTLIFTFSTVAGKLKGITFGMNEAYTNAVKAAGVRPLGGFYMDVVYGIETNTYNGISSVQIRLKDFKVNM